MPKAIKSVEALTAHVILRKVGFVKRVALQNLMSKQLGFSVSDDTFELAMSQLRIIRVSGVGGGICLA